ncbi:hypothetical protein BZA77DRAFT_346835 [Pyronema omphalodes]|nr:hypothetical protein BZA77DRAFT_346835 [Pyronema omphalodes]
MPHNTSMEAQHSSEPSSMSNITTTNATPKDGLSTFEIPEQLAPTYQCFIATCPQKDKIFQGHGAKTAWRRHQNTHSKPFTCPEPHCGRHIKGHGFSRKDNLRDHISKKHRKGNKRHVPNGDNRSGVSAIRQRSGMERRRTSRKLKDVLRSLRNVLDTLEEACDQIVETDSEDEDDDDDDD